MHIKLGNKQVLKWKNSHFESKTGNFRALKMDVNYILPDFNSHWLNDASIIWRPVKKELRREEKEVVHLSMR